MRNRMILEGNRKNRFWFWIVFSILILVFRGFYYLFLDIFNKFFFLLKRVWCGFLRFIVKIVFIGIVI